MGGAALAAAVPYRGKATRFSARDKEVQEKRKEKATIIAAISIAPFLRDNAEHTAFHKTNKNVYTETSKITIV